MWSYWLVLVDVSVDCNSLHLTFQIHLEEGPGDILVFLTGQEEIESIERLIHERLPKLPESKCKLLVIPIFASLPSEKQMKVFMPPPNGYRKVVPISFSKRFSLTGQQMHQPICGYYNLNLSHIFSPWIIL